jgi:predicted TPR repeat methyltransferase
MDPAEEPVPDPGAPPDELVALALPRRATAIDIDALRRAVHDRPTDGRAWYDLGCALNECHDALGALRALDCALTVVPDQVDAACERGVALAGLRSFEAAAEAFEDVLATQPLHSFALLALANVRYRQGRFDEAAALWRHAEAVSPDPSEALENLALAFRRANRPEDEKGVWRELLALRPGQPTALHHLAAMGEGPVPPRASDGYLVRLFDGFAPEFDQTLAALGYQAPQILGDLLRRVLGEPRAALDVLDAGCGTGLCAPHLRPWAAHLVGVDLSAGMLDRARARGLYDRLVHAELTSYLSDHPASYDVVVSSDTLIYFGDLDALLGSALGSLRTGGWLAVSVEQMPNATDAPGYRLEAHGRYSHSHRYVCSVVERHGGRVHAMRPDTVRLERGEPVAGWFVLAQRP